MYAHTNTHVHTQMHAHTHTHKILITYNFWLGADVVNIHVDDAKTLSTVTMSITTRHIHCSLYIVLE